MRASIHADGTTFRLRCTSGPAGTEYPDCKGELEGVPHRDVVGVETTAEMATRWLRELPPPPEWTEVSHPPLDVDFWCAPNPEDTFHYLGVEGPLCWYWLVRTR